MFGEKLSLPIVLDEVKDAEIYYTSLHGSQLICSVFDGEHNLVARGQGMSWNENYQKLPVDEWGQKHILEIVTGKMNAGQVTISSMNFMHLNDTLPTYKNLVSRRELQIMVQIAEHEDPKLAGLVIDVFQGCHIAGQSGNWNSQTLYLRNAQMIYRKRLTGLEWARLTEDSLYPASSAVAVTANAGNVK